MTSLGTLIFSVIAALFVAGIGVLVWFALRESSAVTPELKRAGWGVETPEYGTTKWIARSSNNGVATSVEVTSAGVRNKSVWTSVRIATDTETDDVLVTSKVPAFLAADGALTAAFGFTPPPRWNGGSPAFVAGHDAYASDERAAARWLPQASQNALIEYNNTAQRKIAIRFFEGSLEARWAEEPRNLAQIEGIVTLLDLLRRQRKHP